MATGAGPTLIWDNMSWWYDEVKRLLGFSGKVGTVPYHDWIHGTSAKQDAAVARLNKDRIMHSSMGVDSPIRTIESDRVK